ncbi:MAG: hypothetical protein O7D34_11900 [Ignavibacteria bacterium]|nr:hypothetical protein [Ignavibacteria bacterium]
MKKSFAMPWAVLAMVVLLLAGCSKDDGTVALEDQPPVGVTNELEAIKYFAASDEFVQNVEETFADKDMEPMDYGSFGKIAADIIPVRFGRFINSVTRTITVTVEPGDTIAIAHVEKEIDGIFKILAKYDLNDTVFVLIEKPFTDKATRNIIFKRVDRNPRIYWRNWLPVATSLVEGGTAPQPVGDEINLTMIQMFLPNGDTITVTDPNSYYLRYRWVRHLSGGPNGGPPFDGGHRDVPEVNGGDQVILQATLVSASPDTDLVALRYGFGRDHRRRMGMELISETDNGDGTFTRVFQIAYLVHFHTGFFHAGVDAITKATLFDDVAPYSVSWWGVPYRVF